MPRLTELFAGRLALLALALWLGACAAEPPPPPGLADYIEAQEALAADDFVAARSALERLRDSGPPAVKEAAAQAAGAEVGDLRMAFRGVSEVVARQPVPEGYALAYCPMVMDARGENEIGGHWVQREGKVMNPYFGAAMLHCGAFREGRGAESP